MGLVQTDLVEAMFGSLGELMMAIEGIRNSIFGINILMIKIVF